MSHSRYSGILILGFGLLLVFVVIPYDTEIVDYGWMRPQTLPNILAWVLVANGAFIAFKVIDAEASKPTHIIKASKYFAIVIAGVYFISLFGFLVVSPILALVLMWKIGERRRHWLALGVVGIPLLIWLVVVVLLERPLP